MQERDSLTTLLIHNTAASKLCSGSTAADAVRALQTMLHWLGFDNELNWKKYGADGDYGRSTSAAVAAFASRNGSSASGTKVTQQLLQKILDRYDILEELKQLSDDLNRELIDRFYRFRGEDKIRIASLQTLLNDLGFGEQLKWHKYGADGDYGKSTTAAVKAFADREGDRQSDGRKLTTTLANNIVRQVSARLGDRWNQPTATSQQIEKLDIKSVIGNGNRQHIKVSNGTRSKQFVQFRKGLYTLGSHKPLKFVQSGAAELRALKIGQSEINIMIAVAENEGNLDAVNTWDNAFLSFGMFQWTAGVDQSRGELPALVARIKNEDSELFERYFGRYGLDTADLSRNGVYGRFSLHGTTLKTALSKEQLRKPAWAFYFWLAGQDPAIQAIEVKHALGRLDQFYSTDDYLVVNQYKVSDLVTSEYGVCLLLDNHVNRPAYVSQCLAKALDETGLSDPQNWGSVEEHSLLDAYLRIRVEHGRSPMTDAVKRAARTRKYLSNGTISDDRGSFKQQPV